MEVETMCFCNNPLLKLIQIITQIKDNMSSEDTIFSAWSSQASFSIYIYYVNFIPTKNFKNILIHKRINMM